MCIAPPAQSAGGAILVVQVAVIIVLMFVPFKNIRAVWWGGLGLLIVSPLFVFAQVQAPIPELQELPPPTEPAPFSASPGVEALPTEERTMPPTPAPVSVDVGRALDIRNQARLTNLGANLSTRLETTIARLEQINARLIARQGIMNNLGIDTTTATSDVTAAQTALAAAKSRLVTIDADVARTVGSVNPQASWLELRATYASTRTDIVAAHQAQIRALTTLKNLSLAPNAVVEPINP